MFADLAEFWSAQLSRPGGRGWCRRRAGSSRWTPRVGGCGRVAGPPDALCITDPAQIAGNAFYCPGQDGIVFDSAGLVPVLLGSYGSAGLAAAFAHEFGHAVQAQAGPSRR